METIGFIGLGIMGTPMAGHLQDAGHPWSPSTSQPAAEGTRRQRPEDGHRQPTRWREAADIIITMLPDTPQVADVLFGEDGVASGLSKGKLVIDMSSISPIETKEFAKKIMRSGADYLDAPVSGGEVGAKTASLSIMVGGEDEGASSGPCRCSS